MRKTFIQPFFFCEICLRWYRSHSANSTQCAEWLYPSISVLSAVEASEALVEAFADLRITAEGIL